MVKQSRQVLYFLIAEGCIYVTFLIGDLLGASTDGIKFLSIILCTAAAIGWGRRSSDRFVPLALVLTLAAELFLLFTKQYLIGVLLFCAVQTVYALRFSQTRCWIWRMGMYAVVLILLGFLGGLTPLSAAAAWSFVQLSISAVTAWKNAEGRLFAVGMSLFWACDLCVGLRFLISGTGPLKAAIVYGIWFFYLPAQVCIVSSILHKSERKH